MAVGSADQHGEVSDAELDIGEVQRRSGLPASTLHLWERRGLIVAWRRKGLRRQYRPDVMDRIAVIILCQRSGFSLEEIAELLVRDAFQDGKTRLEDKVVELEERRDQLDRAISGLRHAIDCPEPNPVECPKFKTQLIDVLPVRR